MKISFDTDEVLGFLADEINSEPNQTEINEDNIFLHNMRRLFYIISEKCSKWELEFLFDEISNKVEEKYWKLILTQIIKHYHLNNLKIVLSDGLQIEKLDQDIKDILIFIKYDIFNYLLDKNLSLTDTRENFLISLKNIKDVPKLILWSFYYLDEENYRLFIKTISEEKDKPYIE